MDLDTDFLFDLNQASQDKINYCLGLTKAPPLGFQTLESTMDSRHCLTIKSETDPDKCAIILIFQPDRLRVDSLYVGTVNDQFQADTRSSAATSFTGLLIFMGGRGTYLGGWQSGKYHGYGVYSTTDGVSY